MQIRPATAADHARLVAITNLTHTRGLTKEEFTANLTHLASQGPISTLVLELDGEIAGHGMLSRPGAFLPEGGFHVTVRVDPAYSRRGLGSALLQALEEQAVAWGGTLLEAGVRDNRPDWLAFAQGRGYVLKEHFFSSELDLATFDPAPYLPLVAQAEASGYRFITMADLPAEEGQRQLYELDMACSVDEPDKGPGWEPVPFEAFRADHFSPLHYDPRAIFLAMKGDEMAGVSGCRFPPGRQSAWVYFTGVRRAHRGHRLAQALKVLACEYVRSRGDCTKIATGNHARNAPMLAINRKFGFVPLPGSYILRKML